MLIGAGIVDDNVKRAVLRHHLMHHTGVRDIEPHGGRTHLPGQVRRSGCIEVTDHDLGSGVGKASHDRSANALCSPRNECAAAV
jgi:hypothetical protein